MDLLIIVGACVDILPILLGGGVALAMGVVSCILREGVLDVVSGLIHYGQLY